MSFLYCQRPYSIRTRIKTRSDDRSHGRQIVRDHIPLEQGLRLVNPVLNEDIAVSETIFH